MERKDIINWVVTEFQPVDLATPVDTILQCIDNAIRYWNTHSSYKITRMYAAAASQKRIQLDPIFKSVVRVYPAAAPDWILQSHPVWTLLGITLIDNLTSDLVAMSEAFKNYRYYIGTDFHFTFERNEDPAVGGYLYLENLPYNTTRIAVVGTSRIIFDDNDAITNEYQLNWLLAYVKALVLQVEGNTLRKSDAINIKNDGQALLDQGREEMKTLQDKLTIEGRWVGFVRKF